MSSLMNNGKHIDIFEALKLKDLHWLLADLEGKKLIMINIMSSLCAEISKLFPLLHLNACSLKVNIADTCLQMINNEFLPIRMLTT